MLASVDKYCDVHRLSFNDWIQGPGCVCLTVPKILPEFLTADTLKVGHLFALSIWQEWLDSAGIDDSGLCHGSRHFKE